MIARPAPSGLLDAFASAYRNDPQALARFMALHPDYAQAFAAYAHEIALQAACQDDARITSDDEGWIATQVAAVTQMRTADPFSRWSPSDYQIARRVLGVPSSVLTAFRDRLVALPSVPLAFLERLAELLGVGMLELAEFLRGQPRLAAAASYKADGAPVAPSEKASFTTVLIDANVSPEVVEALLDEDD